MKLINESAALAEQIFDVIDVPLYDESKRVVLSDIACSMSFEHWESTLGLLKVSNLTSAVVVHRAQFEAILRSIWLLYAAKDEYLDKLSAELNLETEQQAKNIPQTADMMAAISNNGPRQAFDTLNRFKENNWKALNSYVHAGIHPLSRHAEGYPMRLTEDIAKNANGLAVVTALQASVLTGNQSLQAKVMEIAGRFPQCMPPPL